VVIAGQDQHTTVWRAAKGIAVFEGITRAVDSRAFAVPDGKDPIDLARRITLHLLRTQHGGGSQVFIDCRQKLDHVPRKRRRATLRSWAPAATSTTEISQPTRPSGGRVHVAT
jgi:hypothetical protein